MLQEMIKMRRYFHRKAEPAWLEFQTTVRIIEILKDMGYDVKYGKEIYSGDRMGLPKESVSRAYRESLDLNPDFDISEILEGYTGAIITLDTGKEGPAIGLRFDIDANDLHESDSEEHRPRKEGFASENDFAMHGCGHDAHITIGLHVAKWLMENKENLKGSYVIVFQPSEEGTRGARALYENGYFDDLDYFLAMHIGIALPTGKIGVGSGGIFATSKIDVEFKGVTAHAGAKPEEGKNALLAAAAAALNLHTLPQVSMGMSRLNVGTIRGGTGRNVVPGSAELKLEVRGENDEIVEYLVNRTKEVVEGAAMMYGVEGKFIEMGLGQALKYDDLEFYDEVENFLKEEGYDTVYRPSMNASEDVTYYMNRVSERGGKSIHFMIGTDLKAGHHNEKFDINEEDIKTSYDVITKTINYLQNK